jgi:hypothetical protein
MSEEISLDSSETIPHFCKEGLINFFFCVIFAPLFGVSVEICGSVMGN